MKIIQVKTHKSYIIKKPSNNKVSFVEFILNSKQFKLMITGSQPHGARWPRFNCVQMIELGGSCGEKDDNEHSLLVHRDHRSRPRPRNFVLELSSMASTLSKIEGLEQVGVGS